MGFFDRFKEEQKEMMAAEQRLLELLTAGNAPEFARLRAQWSEPFGMWIERRRYKDYFSIDLIHDAHAADDASAGPNLKLKIDDLIVIDRRLRSPIACVGWVDAGLLTNIHCIAPEPVRWPRYLNVDDWFYLDAAGGQSKTRRHDWADRIAASHVPAVVDPEIDRVVPADYRDYITRRDTARDIHDVTLLPVRELYFLDHPKVNGRFVVFGSTADASVMAFRISTGDQVDGVYSIDVDEAKPERVANDFTQWRTEGSL